jgi:hypothetical protein
MFKSHADGTPETGPIERQEVTLNKPPHDEAYKEAYDEAYTEAYEEACKGSLVEA